MREIKFRAWDKVSKRMINLTLDNGYWSLTLFEDGSWKADGYNGEFLSNDDAILMQYTGLLDKNGTEVFEGDIVTDGNSSYRDIKNFEVKWDESWAAFVLQNGNCVDSLELKYQREEYESIAQVQREQIDYYKWEVIGNKYKNPELLNV